MKRGARRLRRRQPALRLRRVRARRGRAGRSPTDPGGRARGAARRDRRRRRRRSAARGLERARPRRGAPRAGRRGPAAARHLRRHAAPVRRERGGRPRPRPARRARSAAAARAASRTWAGTTLRVTGARPPARRASTAGRLLRPLATRAEPAEPTSCSPRSTTTAAVVAAVERGAVAGVQFHPERSGRPARAVLRERDRMVKKRVIPCLDVAGGRVVKGVRFEDLRDFGDPVELAHALLGARRRRARLPRHHRVDRGPRGRCSSWSSGRPPSSRSRSPSAAASRSSRTPGRCSAPAPTRSRVNRAAVDARAAHRARRRVRRAGRRLRDRRAGGGEVVTHGGRTPRGLDAVEWAQEAVERGAGEILLTSIDADGTRDGYDLELTRAVADGGARARDRLRRRGRRRAPGRRRSRPAPRRRWSPRSSTSGRSGCRS